MADRETYTKIHEDWKNDPDRSTPIYAEDMEHIEQALYDIFVNMALEKYYRDNAIRLSSPDSGTSPYIRSLEMGFGVKATGNASAAIGSYVEVSGNYAFGAGWNLEVGSQNQFVCGKYNVKDTDGKYLFIVGGGNYSGDRKNVHTVDKDGNAYFRGDIANDTYSLNDIGASLAALGTRDVTEQSSIYTFGQSLEITVPLNTIMNAYGYYIIGGDFVGVVRYSNMPPMRFNLSVSAVKNGEINGKAVLTNLENSSIEMFGYKFEGEIQLLPYSDPEARVIFNLGREIENAEITIYRTAGSAVDFSIAELRGEEKEETVVAKVFGTKEELDNWLAVDGNSETLKVGQNIYIVETVTPDYWWDGTGLQVLETDKVEIDSMTYDETMAILNVPTEEEEVA